MFLRLSLYTSQYKIMISVSQNKIVMAFNDISMLNIILGVVPLISGRVDLKEGFSVLDQKETFNNYYLICNLLLFYSNFD